MRQARIRGEGKSYYHCISRVVDRQFVLKEEEKEHFVALMRKLEAFHGMRVVTYCVMSNHFHLLVEEPDRESVVSLDAETIFRRIGFLYDTFTVRTVEEEWERARAAGDTAWEEEILDRYRNRMGDLSGFMKDLKISRDRLTIEQCSCEHFHPGAFFRHETSSYPWGGEKLLPLYLPQWQGQVNTVAGTGK